MLRIFYSLSLIFIFSACANEKYDALLLPGEWNTTSWVVEKTNKKIENKMDFTFGTDGRYEIDYGTVKESGKYWIAGDFLHTVEDGESEKKVKLTKLTADQMDFQMNRTGYIELVSLSKN